MVALAVLVLRSFFGHPKRYARSLEDVSLHGHTFVEFDEVVVPRLTSGKCELDGQVFGIVYILRVTLSSGTPYFTAIPFNMALQGTHAANG